MSTLRTKHRHHHRSSSKRKQSKSTIHINIRSSKTDNGTKSIRTTSKNSSRNNLSQANSSDISFGSCTHMQNIDTFANSMDYRTGKRKKKKKKYSKLFYLIIILAILLIISTIIILLIKIRRKPTMICKCSVNNVTIQPPGGFAGASILYTFDNTPDDYYGNYNASPLNNPEFISPGYNGRGSAVQLFRNRSQCFSVPNHMNFYNKSFTMEAWIYPSINALTVYDAIIYLQINASLAGQAMYTTLRYGRFLGAFMFIDAYGLTIFKPNQWQHLAFTYNFSTRTQTVYLNGVIDAINTNADPCQVTHGKQHIGCHSGTDGYFDGYMDQLSFLFNRSKTADEILGDATLVAYYTMDCTNVDSGPNHMSSTAVDLSQGDGGRVRESFLFNLHSSYFQVTQLLLLGEWYRPFSFAMWLRPVTSVTVGGTILHLSRDIDGTNSCAQLIGLNSFGQIVVHGLNTSGLVELVGPVLKTGEWIHIVETYSQTNGLRLYVSGTLYDQSSPFSYAASGMPMTVTLGQALRGENCLHGTIRTGYYRGQIDEFYIYSRELSQAHVTALSNPSYI